MSTVAAMRFLALIFSSLLVFAQAKFPLPPPEPKEPPVDFVCPMDPDVHANQPGKCPRCGMTLVAGIPDETEYPVVLTPTPATLKAGAPVQLAFEIRNPKTGDRVTKFEIVHDKLFHMFIVSQDLQFFVHDHPVKGDDSVFRYNTVLPRTGMYRVLSDFYPTGGVPQLIATTLIVPGGPITAGGQLAPDVAPKKTANMTVSLTTDPPQPIAGMKTLMFFHLDPADGLEPYLSAWGHMLAASQDLVDLIHTHPFLADGGPQVQFNLIFPRPGVYRIWVQFQRKGVVNTARFDIPVNELK
jgi:hypothetical protein